MPNEFSAFAHRTHNRNRELTPATANAAAAANVVSVVVVVVFDDDVVFIAGVLCKQPTD